MHRDEAMRVCVRACVRKREGFRAKVQETNTRIAVDVLDEGSDPHDHTSVLMEEEVIINSRAIAHPVTPSTYISINATVTVSTESKDQPGRNQSRKIDDPGRSIGVQCSVRARECTPRSN